jgi:hypothetical protein
MVPRFLENLCPFGLVKNKLGRTKTSSGMCLKEVRTVVLVGRPDGKIALGRSRRRWNGNMKMDLQGVELGGIVWIALSQVRDRWRTLVNAVNEPSVSVKCREFVDKLRNV